MRLAPTTARSPFPAVAMAVVIALVLSACGGDPTLTGDVASPTAEPVTAEPTLPAEADENVGAATPIAEATATTVPNTPEAPTATAPPAEPTPTAVVENEAAEPDVQADADDDQGTSGATTTSEAVDVANAPLGLASTAESPVEPSPFLVAHTDNLWEVDVFGLIEEADTESDEVCFALLYTATAIDLGNRFADQLASPFDWRDTRLAATGEDALIERTFSSCDVIDRTEELGYFETSNFLNGAVEGGRIHLSESFRAPTGTTIESIVFGDPTDDDQPTTYLQADVLDGIPSPTPNGFEADAESLAGTTIRDVGVRISFAPPDRSDLWDISFDGLVVTDMSSRDAETFGDGSCAIIVGSATLTNAEFAITSVTTPTLELTAGGVRAEASFTRCFSEELLELGYQPLGLAQVTEGTTFHFQHSFDVHQWAITEPLHLVVSKYPTLDTSTLLNADVVDIATIGAAELGAPAPLLESTQGSSTNAEFTWVDSSSENQVGVDIQGVVELGPNRNDDGTCYVVFTTLTIDSEIRSTDIPRFSLVASGWAKSDAFGTVTCDVSSLEDAGWTRLNAPSNREIGTHAVAIAIDVPNQPAREIERLIVGDPVDPNAGVFSVDLLASAPSPN